MTVQYCNTQTVVAVFGKILVQRSRWKRLKSDLSGLSCSFFSLSYWFFHPSPIGYRRVLSQTGMEMHGCVYLPQLKRGILVAEELRVCPHFSTSTTEHRRCSHHLWRSVAALLQCKSSKGREKSNSEDMETLGRIT